MLSVQDNGGLLPDMIRLTQGYYHRGTRLNVMWRGFFFAAYETVCCYYPLFDDVLYYYNVSVSVFVWSPCMAVNLSVQYNIYPSP